MNESGVASTARYPRLSIDLGTIASNVRAVSGLCAARGIGVTGVVKGSGALVPVAAAMARGGCASLASSRLVHLRALVEARRDRASGIPPEMPLGLLRIPGPSEIADMVELADWSLQSDPDALSLTAEAARRAGRRHGVVLMLDLGDLREGWFDDDALIGQAVRVERTLPSLHLRGIGANLSCYGSIMPTPENLGRLAAVARRVEAALGRRLEVVSGGATSSLPLVLRGTMPEGITELRLGESVLCARDMPHFHRVDIPGVRSDAFTFRAEIVEARLKPSLPVGERFIDAFGERPEYEDRGVRTRLVLAAGKRDFGSHAYLLPRDPRIHVVGSSSDHLLCEADEPCGDLRYGAIVEFDLLYAAMLFLTDGNPYVQIEFIGSAGDQTSGPDR